MNSPSFPQIIKKLLTTANLVKLSGEMLFIIAQLIDLSIHSYTKQQIKFEFEALLICLLNTIKLLGEIKGSGSKRYISSPF